LKAGIAGRIAQAFINSKLTPLLLVASLLVGVFGTLNTPREEEPQIIVPLVDIFIPYPGSGPREVEERITKPLEKVISQIQGVEYIYSMSRQDFAVITVRYLVGENMEDSLVKLWATILKHMDRRPPGVEFPLLKTTSIDDVPVVTLTLWSDRYDGYQLRRVGAEIADEIKSISDVSAVEIDGGLRRQVRVIIDQNKLKAHGIAPLQVAQQIQTANQQLTAGAVQRLNREYIIRTGEFLEDADDVAGLVIGVSGNHPVYLMDVAEIVDGPEEVSSYVFFGMGPAETKRCAGVDTGEEYPAVTLEIAKRKGSDAMRVADQVMKKVEALREGLIPGDIRVTETRNYGETASEKVSTLLEHLLGAIIAVTIVVGLFLGWRGGLVVFASVPITFALTLFVYYLFGYTLNRVTLFALIFVTGIVVDDSIIVAENVHRHFTMGRLPRLQAALAAIGEVGNPTILATFTVIASVLPMAFVSGLMGPYMSPMPIGASVAMLFSLLVALVGTPWLAFHLLKAHGLEREYRLEDTRIYGFYKKTLLPLLDDRKRAAISIAAVSVLLLVSVSLFLFRAVEVKILPYDNKSEMQVIVDMPEGTTLEQTARVAKEISAYLTTVPEVRNYQYYVGTNAPINFNGLVRHYYLRSGPTVADIQVNLVEKGERGDQSHDIAKRLRPEIQKIASRYSARVKVAEVPPGPPVLSTLVAEIYGPDYDEQIALARKVRDVFDETPGVVDVDWLVEEDQLVYDLVVDKEKAALRGVNTDQVALSLRMGLSGTQVALLHDPNELEPVGIEVRLARDNRTSLDDLGGVHVRSASGGLIPVVDLVQIRETTEAKTIYRKNQQRVVFVTGDVAGVAESPVYAMLQMNGKIREIVLPDGHTIEPLYTRQPFLEEDLSMKWDGEWQITYEVFRDLGGAFAVVLVIIYLLTIGWFQSFRTPLVMMIAIPLSLVGIIPGHWIHGAFFTATSMIGMIALAGIMVRNSVLLIDFIEIRRAEGGDLKEAVIEAGAVRTRPIALTAGTVVIGAIVILFDPIFQGLAISLMWGAFASTVLTLVIVPVVYYLVESRRLSKSESPPEGAGVP
jgi:multidrug efflux pump subunit AcrB